MVEWLELRVLEEHAKAVFSPDDGEPLSSGRIRKIRLRTDDPRIERVRDCDRVLRRRNERLFLGWDYIRKYRTSDIRNAAAFLLCKMATFEPEGEQCGTVYDDAAACVCGVPRRQVGPLRLHQSRIPRGVHLARTIADEVIVSRELLHRLESRGIRGVLVGPVYSGGTELADWRQLLTGQGDLVIGADTEIGNGPFDRDPDPRYICPAGCVRGLNLLSELTLASPGLAGRHIAFTRHRIGVRRGVLVPKPLIVISPAFRSVLGEGLDRGCRLEVVYPEGARDAA